MKRLANGWLAVALGLFVAAAASAYTGSYTPGAGINNTPHDLPNTTTGMGYQAANPTDPLNRICIFCHAPHNTYRLHSANGGPGAGVGSGPEAPMAYDYLPLWNHALTQNLVYQMYQNGPGAPQVGDKASQAIEQFNALGTVSPNGTSLLCLSCHDGSVAVNVYGNADQPATSRSNGAAFIGAGYIIGKDAYLGNHHPISFDYDQAWVADGEIRDPGAFNMTATTTVRDHLYGAGNTKLECGSCHSVHNTGNGGESLLWRTDAGSGLCLACHAKGTYVAP
jgi:predicted CXXCH cytochrome family protein